MPELSFPTEELRKQKLFVATPMYGGMCAGMFARSVADLSALCTAHGIPLQFYFLFNESLITRARNYCCDEFMRSDATHLMFIDSDIGFNPHDVLCLLGMTMDKNGPYDIVGGPYPKKCISWEKIKLAVDKGFAEKDPNVLENFVGDYVFNPKGGTQTIKISEPCEVMEIGTGFMMIRKDAMAKFRDGFPDLTYRPDHVRTAAFDGSREITMYFQAEIDQHNPVIDFKKALESIVKNDGIGAADAARDVLDQAIKDAAPRSKRYLSEDYLFCQMANRIGLKIWFCPWMKLQHVGTYVFGGSLQDLASIGASATADPGALKKTNGLVPGG